MGRILSETYGITDAILHSDDTYISPSSLSFTLPSAFKIKYKAYHTGSSANGVYMSLGGVLVGTHTVYGGAMIIRVTDQNQNYNTGIHPPNNTWYDLELTYENGLWTYHSDYLNATITHNYTIPNNNGTISPESSNAQFKEILIIPL